MFDYNTQPRKFKFHGEITVAGDKSIAHRAIIFGALANGVTQISNFTYADDLTVTAKVFQKLGAKIHTEVSSKAMIIKGMDHQLREVDQPLDIANVGTLESLLLGVLASSNHTYEITGGKYLSQRPNKNVVELLNKMGANFRSTTANALPLKVTGKDDLQGIVYHQDISSAQIKSSLVLAGIYAKTKTTIIRKLPTRNHTENLANYFGARIDIKPDIITIYPGYSNLTGQNLTIPGDFSSAAFYIAGALLSSGSEITLPKIGLNSTRIGMLNVVKQMGAKIQVQNQSTNRIEPYGDLIVKSQQLHGTTITAKQVPFIIDEIPLVALVASQVSGRTIINGIHDVHLQISDRIRNMRVELAKLGIVMQVDDDSIVIDGDQKIKVKDDVDSHNDHRIAMMLCIASILTDSPFKIKNIEAIDTSYPGFIADLNKVLVTK
ncbi:3-phosphoshikimate 1-carboxyvinyltransferase [Companilactobacillus crustorum]|uniref:3-phosphoshikimate 1-carboxyvinyltransferase n=3 Tax=Companilactobacillus TaxID=2767879 RepID=A0A837RHU6_9LACO|nr:3-phosphoshikimate 1-carboxyvinyltransferase [Companilactobacillus crustorum]HCD08696.1 3-phosphoshikimate 1-carboxyvinyltransferase [Lactobacillus sp.]APU71539.1 3-phosphoshikimate 1-carboxyvinyltransferase [Companilactobacillus crustorum]KRK43141.1 3-phosphoshikimate 1-carboxyvinyltransferase [Companilactobacillus crustorum JCM 15951]KRO20782.1 3-phosphoshikimate 1-carboxyvinyltransferase [Companilactobacillus crustorum]WDT66437.1 3-phosphoshikimate 1-carboxyvinyltransferase [Companilacto